MNCVFAQRLALTFSCVRKSDLQLFLCRSLTSLSIPSADYGKMGADQWKESEAMELGHVNRWWFGACLHLPLRFPASDLWTTSETCCGGSELAERRLLRPRPVAHIPLGLSLPSLDKNYIIAACDLILLKEHFEVSFPLFSFLRSLSLPLAV